MLESKRSQFRRTETSHNGKPSRTLNRTLPFDWCHLTSPLTTASLKTMSVVLPRVDGTGGAKESSKYPPQCWITCRTHVIPKYLDLFMLLQTGSAELEDRWLRVLLRDVKDEGALVVHASFGVGWPGDLEDAYLLCWRNLIVFNTLTWSTGKKKQVTRQKKI